MGIKNRCSYLVAGSSFRSWGENIPLRHASSLPALNGALSITSNEEPGTSNGFLIPHLKSSRGMGYNEKNRSKTPEFKGEKPAKEGAFDWGGKEK